MSRIAWVDRLEGRVARPAGAWTNLGKTLLQSVAMWLIFFGAAPRMVYRLETRSGLARYRLHSPVWRGVGLALFCLGWTLAWSSGVVMAVVGEGTPLPIDAPRKFVVVGPYRYMRNPMAAGSIVQGVALGLWMRSPSVVAYALLGALSWNYLARPWEELDLERRFGASYARYHADVRCWIPRLTPYEPPEI